MFDKNYEVVLESLGTCDTQTAAALLKDILGFSLSDAQNTVHHLPAVVSGRMTRNDADVIVNMFADYGIESRSVPAKESGTASEGVIAGAALFSLLGLSAVMHRPRPYDHRFDDRRGPRPPKRF